MQHVFDVHAGHGGTRNRREQDAAQRIADGHAVTALERFEDKFAVVAIDTGLELGALLIHAVASEVKQWSRNAGALKAGIPLTGQNQYTPP